MDDRRFDRLATAFAAGSPRRGVLRGLGAVALSAVLGSARAGNAAAGCPNVLCSGPNVRPCPAPCACVTWSNGNNRCLTPTASTCPLVGRTLCGGRCVPRCTGAATLDPATCQCLCPPGYDLCGDETQTSCCLASDDPGISG